MMFSKFPRKATLQGHGEVSVGIRDMTSLREPDVDSLTDDRSDTEKETPFALCRRVAIMHKIKIAVLFRQQFKL